ncbi:hypothetical protein U9M48_001958 [Paspalum notatum var. saurae]|uniref:Uncharacterized protein n=1 Tax=Paspalum notatum var. saurae TaxID=547442 RepID=A0AAQ3SFL4_PASNO
MAHQGAATAAGEHHETSMHTTDSEPEELLRAYLQLWSHAGGFLKSMALKCAMDLRIPDMIQRRGGAATLDDLLAASDLPPSSLPYLHRLMRALTALRIFALHQDDDGQDPAAGASAGAAYQLTAASRLLLTGGDASYFSMVPAIYPLFGHGLSNSMLALCDWMKHDHAATTSLYEVALGKGVWESMEANAAHRARFHDSMEADSRLVMHAVLSHSPAVFHGLTSLVDVGGGRGTAAAAVVRAFPHIKCTVMDLPQVVADASAAGTGGLCFVAGDMFDHIPTADALLLKRILHDWDDAKCIRIMQQCKETISRNEQGRGKVIIIDTVIGYSPNDDMICMEAQVLCDLAMMVASNGAEREEHEWRRIFLEAGFCDYKITHIHGALPSIIEVYPGPVES